MGIKFKRYLAAVTAVLIAIIWAFPVYWMINSSFLTPLTIADDLLHEGLDILEDVLRS